MASVYRTNKPPRYVNNPNGRRMVATRVVNNIPANLKNLNTRLMTSPNAWTANTSNMLNNIRRNNWKGASRNDIIKFVMYGYYGAFHLVKFNMNTNNISRTQIHNFHHAYARISTRDPRNRTMISPEVLWRRLQNLTKASLLSLARIVAW